MVSMEGSYCLDGRIPCFYGRSITRFHNKNSPAIQEAGMANEIVKYDNYLNNLSLSGFSPAELDLLMALCARVKEHGTNELSFSFPEIRELSNFWSTSNEILAQKLDSTNDKLSRIVCRIETEKYIIRFVLFTTFVIDKEKRMLIVSVNPKFAFVLNELSKNFTRFELREFVHLDGKYQKHLYRLLKQYRSTGIFEIRMEDFRRKMDIPKSYKNLDVTEKVIKPSVKGLEKAFPELTFEVQRGKTRGNPVIGYVFRFRREKTSSMNASRRKKMSGEVGKGAVKNQSRGSFFDFEQREYDYEELERMLIRKQEERAESGSDVDKRILEYDDIKNFFMLLHERYDN